VITSSDVPTASVSGRPAAQHRRRGGEQEQREGEQQRPAAIDESVECGAGERSGRAGRAEGERGPDLDAVAAGIVGGADDQQ